MIASLFEAIVGIGRPAALILVKGGKRVFGSGGEGFWFREAGPFTPNHPGGLNKI